MYEKTLLSALDLKEETPSQNFADPLALMLGPGQFFHLVSHCTCLC